MFTVLDMLSKMPAELDSKLGQSSQVNQWLNVDLLDKIPG
ncbi:hypothetical protein SLEP1_g59676 [Rubroshorea leprosula]|uniref:Uncharacterized protein n=1 Tax=Rubroshorea leprosula TaxID=152421 RepID=A0AAV5MVJ8_9ROSI|nr:hypothetical protein SLEP1_g59676 [Rubroshorea leprosula]